MLWKLALTNFVDLMKARSYIVSLISLLVHLLMILEMLFLITFIVAYCYYEVNVFVFFCIFHTLLYCKYCIVLSRHIVVYIFYCIFLCFCLCGECLHIRRPKVFANAWQNNAATKCQQFLCISTVKCRVPTKPVRHTLVPVLMSFRRREVTEDGTAK